MASIILKSTKQFRKNLVASFFAIIAELHAMKWRKRKQPLRATEFRLETLELILQICKVVSKSLIH